MAAPYYGMIEEIRVMLVDDNNEFVIEMVDLLKSYNYKVMTVDTTSTAMSMLSKGKKKFDVIIINVQKLLSFELLAQAVALDIISLFVCDEDNELLAKKAMDEGAYLYVKKPFDKEIMKYLWQFVFRERIQRDKVRKGSEKNRDQLNVDDTDIIGDNEKQPKEKKHVSNAEEQRSNIHVAENHVVSNEKYKMKRKRGRKNTKESNEGESQINATNKVVKGKACIEWTLELHAHFMKAVQQLGEGRCYPIEILRVMNVPGLTRMQVASHLQKCRSNNWRVPEEQKHIRHPSGHGSSSGSQQKSSFRKFGRMPCLQTNLPNLQSNPYQIQKGPDDSFSTLNTDSIFARGESSIQQQLYCPQLQVQPHYLNIGNPFNNPLLSIQNNAGDEIQQQHEPLFGMMDSQGLHGPIIGNTSYRSGLTFNTGDYHTQNDYNLNLNATHGTPYSGNGTTPGADTENVTSNDDNLNVNADNVTTYSDNAMMFDTYVGNVTINELETTNANFRQYIGEPNMSYSSSVVAASCETDIEGIASNEEESCDAYLNFDNMDYLFQNLGPSTANLPNEQDIEFN